jgi:hypothetical protein
VPHAMLDIELTAQLWVRSDQPAPDLPRKLLIADCYAALNPPAELWERWVGNILRLEEHGEITEDQVHALIYHSQARAALFEVTHGNAGALNERTVPEVIDRFESKLREPAEHQALAERERTVDAQRDAAEARQRAEAAEREARGLRGEVAGLRAQTETLTSLIGRARTVLGFAAAAIAVAAFGALAVLDVIGGALWWATSITVTVFLAACGIAWATRRPAKWAIHALILAGAVTALWATIYAVASDEPDRRRAPQETSEGAGSVASAEGHPRITWFAPGRGAA